MAENSSGRRMSITFTLPISCQICLGKVKQPIVCPNQHVFCKSCIDLWLKHNQQCPTCRIPITPENPCKQIIGGHNQENGSDFSMSDPALRRARFDILYQDCENEIKRLQEENKTLMHSNSQLRQRLADTEGALASQSDETSANAKTQNGRHHSAPSPRSSPSAMKLKSRNKPGADMLLQDQQERHGTQSSNDGVGDASGQMLAVLRSKLKQATSMYEKIKEDTNKLKEKNAKLSEDNRNLLLENGRLKQSAATRSPHKYEKYTSMAQQAKVDECQREVTQLKSALDRSDNYIEELETKLDDYRALYGSIPRKRRCHGDEIDAKTSMELLPGVLSAKSESAFAFRGVNSKASEVWQDKLGRTIVSPTSELLNCHNNLANEYDQLVDNLGKDEPKTRSDPGGSYSRDEEKINSRLVGDSQGSQRMLKEISEYKADVVGGDALRRPCINKSDLQDAEQTRQVRTTPSTALGRLSLVSDQKPKKLPSPSDTFSSSPGGLNQSCHRQLDFGKDHLDTSRMWSTLDTSETNSLMLDGNQVSISPLDQNATFSNLNFTLTSEIVDCAQFMKEAEKRLKNKQQHRHDKDVHVETRFPSVDDKNKMSPSDQKGTKRKSPGPNDKGNFQFFGPVHSYQIKENSSHDTYEGCSSSVGHQSNNQKPECSKTQMNTRYVERSCANLKESGNMFGNGAASSSGSHTSVSAFSSVPSTSLKPESFATASFQTDSTKEAFKLQQLSQARYNAVPLRAYDRVAEKEVKLTTDRDRDNLGSQDQEIMAKTRDGHSERPASSAITHAIHVRGTASSKSFFPLPRRVEVTERAFGESHKKIRSDWGSDDDDG